MTPGGPDRTRYFHTFHRLSPKRRPPADRSWPIRTRPTVHAGADVAEQELKDISIIGGGPTGLFAAFYAGMRGASARIIDALPALGGQLMALYPEKYIFDVAGFPKVLAKDLVRDMAAQGLQFGATTHLGEIVTGLRRVEDGNGGHLVPPAAAGGHPAATH